MPGRPIGSDAGLPFASVVMPVRNEARFIEASLRAVLDQDYPADRLDVIVADGMSDDGTRSMIRSVIDATGAAPSVSVIDNPGRIAATGLNAAIAQARGDVIVRVDGHCRVQRDHVRRCVRLLEQTGADNVGGVIVAGGTRLVPRAIARAMSSPFGVGTARFRYATNPGWVDTVPFGAWPREVFDRIGGFDRDLVRNQDDELNFRLVQAGGRIWLDPSIRIDYEVRPDLGALGRQYFAYGLYKVRVIQKRRAVASWRHVVPPLFVGALVTTAVAGAITGRKRLSLAVVAPYAVTTALVSVHSGRADPATVPVLPIVFATLHVSYGAGFLAGLWRWRRAPRS